MYYETNVPNLLLEKFIIKDSNNENIEIKPERNNNNFYEWFTIINAPFQNIKDIYENENLSNFSLNPDTNKEKEGKNIKFILKPQINIKIFYDEFGKYEDKFQSFFDNYFPKQFDVMERDIKYMNNFSDKDLKKDLKDVIIEGFDKYYFNNCRKDYILLRDIW